MVLYLIDSSRRDLQIEMGPGSKFLDLRVVCKACPGTFAHENRFYF